MADKSVSQIHPQPLSNDRQSEEIAAQLCVASGAVNRLGALVFAQHSDGVRGLTDTDMEGMGLALQALGAHIERLSSDLESGAG